MTAEGPTTAAAPGRPEPVLDGAHLGHVAIFRFEMAGQPPLTLEFN